MSGFLGKKEDSWRTFWRKNVNGLVMPFLLLSLLINVPYIIHNISDARRMVYLAGGIVFGFHSLDGMYVCLNMWFVYCLLLVKIMFQCSVERRVVMSLVAFCAVGMAAYHFCGLEWKWAVTDVLYAYPYFVVGYWFKRMNMVRVITARLDAWQWNVPIAVAVIGTGFLADYNGIAYTYQGVGNSLTVMVLCSVVNIMFMIRLSYRIQHFKPEFMRTISKGSIILLAFHLMLLYPMARVIRHFLGDYEMLDAVLFVGASVFICILFIPVIRFVNRRVPILMGRR